MPESRARDRRDALVGLVLDVAAVVVFVIAGTRSHDEDDGLGGVLAVAAPFLIGLGVAWLVIGDVRRRPWSVRAGVEVVLTTLVVGMVLRRTAFDRGTAASFVVVTAIVLGVLLLGWRAFAGIMRRRTAVRSPGPPSRAER
ncbi:MAG: DUF3054 domain-containing protein [Ilumatobacteraceae bacterium]